MSPRMVAPQMPAARGNAREQRQARVKGRDKYNMNEDMLLQRIAQLEDRIEELDAFAFSVSHDLQAPLRTVASYARILEEDHTGEMSEAARACLAKIVRATRDMGYLIDELLALSRSDNHPVTMSLVDMPVLVRHVLDELVPRDTDRIQLVVEALGPCLGNPRLLEQVWANLISNALKFSRERDPAVLEIGSVAREHLITYFVRDNGVGFDSLHANDLFMPFRRYHDQLKYEGQGLGLSIARRIVARHGGSMWAESSPGEGATFYFTLPRG